MFHCADQIVKQLRAISRSPQLESKSIARAFSALVMVLAMLAGGTVKALAQDLSKYGASAISVIAGSPTAGQSFANGVPATSVGLTGILAARVDAAGNVYFIQENVVRMLYVSGPVPSILQHAVADYSLLPDASTQPASAAGGQGNVYSLVNVEDSGSCADMTCGDGASAATSVVLSPYALALDSAGNLYIADLNNNAVRKVNAATGTISTVAGDPLRANSGYNGDNQPAITAFLEPIGLAFDADDNLFVADIANQLIRRIDAQTQVITTVAGNAASPGAASCQSATTCGDGGAATSASLLVPYGVAVNSAGDIFISDNGLDVVRKVAHDTGIITAVAGQFNTPCADSLCGGEGVSATTATLNAPEAINFDAGGGLLIADSGDQAIRGLTTDGKIYTLAGVLSQSGNTNPIIFSGHASAAQFNLPNEAVTDAANHLIIADTNPYIWQVTAPSVLLPQTITFTRIPAATYGNPTFDLTNFATADSGLPIAFTCTGAATCTGTNGATLTITGAGSVTVTANQAGDATYGPATPQTSIFAVAKAVLTVRAVNISYTLRSAATLPPLTYTITGLVNGDSATEVTGAAVLSTTATPNSAVGQYPITVAVGTLAAANYTFTPMAGTLTVTGGATQTITFNSLPNLTYGAATFTLQATASSGEPIAYTVSGPAQILGNRITVTGVGAVTVTANQAGDEHFGAATSVTQPFQVAPAVLSIAAQPATRAYNDVNPAFTYAATGFVSADASAVLSGAPAFSTTAVMASAPGNYPLMISQGTLFATNYTFTFINSTLLVGQAAQAITFPAAPNAVFGTGIPLTATASSGLPVQYTVVGQATIVSGELFDGRPGVVSVTATQPGNDVYQPAAPVVVTYTFQKEPLILQANNFSVPFGGALPLFTYQFGNGSFTPPANEFNGVPDLESTATSASAPGQYPIVATAGTLTSDYFNFQYVNGTLTILQPSSFILTATPASVVIPIGQVRQVTVTLTPVNDFVGTVSIECSGLPTGVSCVSSPNSLTTTLSVGGVNPVTSTLTISAGAAVASAQNKVEAGKLTLAGLAWLPALMLGAFLAWRRRSFQHSRKFEQMLFVVLMLLGASGMIACGSSNKSASVQPSVTTIQVTGSGSSTSGPATASLALSVTIQ